jgi:hypothetical protein
MEAEGLGSEAELQSWFVRRISDYLASKGRKLIGTNTGWGGGRFRSAECWWCLLLLQHDACYTAPHNCKCLLWGCQEALHNVCNREVLGPMFAGSDHLCSLLLLLLLLPRFVCSGWDEILEGGLAEGATVMSWRVSEGLGVHCFIMVDPGVSCIVIIVFHCIYS